MPSQSFQNSKTLGRFFEQLYTWPYCWTFCSHPLYMYPFLSYLSTTEYVPLCTCMSLFVVACLMALAGIINSKKKSHGESLGCMIEV